MKATIDDVEKHPGDYLHRVLEGETVVLFRDNRAVAEIRPLKASVGPRPFGLAAGEFVVPDDFDDPLPDDLLDAFEGRWVSWGRIWKINFRICNLALS